MEFGRILRDLRKNAGLGIKRLAPELGVNYTFLSRLENNDVGPSEAFVRRVANYFGYDHDLLLLAAGKVPADVRKILQDHPHEALELLRAHFGPHKNQRQRLNR
jgi:transcriptional regulator with XRE-family HTH domain